MPVAAQSIDDLIKTLEPGIGYSKFKQWVIDNKLVYESFTKDQLTVRDAGVRQGFSLRILARFCAGDDYAGRASQLTIQQLFQNPVDALMALRDASETLSGSGKEGRLLGQFGVRRDRNEGPRGIAILQEGEKGSWEIGLFTTPNFMVQIIRRRDAICNG
jgi:hypothetical protein